MLSSHAFVACFRRMLSSHAFVATDRFRRDGLTQPRQAHSGRAETEVSSGGDAAYRAPSVSDASQEDDRPMDVD